MFKEMTTTGKATNGVVLVVEAPSANDKSELLDFMVTQSHVDDTKSLKKEIF